MAKGKSSTAALVGSWGFLVGFVLAVLLGLGYTGAYRGTVVWLVVLLGVVVGLLNVTHDEASAFLTSGTVLVLVSYLGASMLQDVSPLGEVLQGVLTLFVPATLIVALRSVWTLARRE